MHIHFDGDLLVYRCGFAAEKQLYHVGDETFTTLREAKRLSEEVGEDVVKGERELEPVENALASTGSGRV
jgi:hypothetical protein